MPLRNYTLTLGHARPLDSRIIWYVRDGRTDRETDGRTKATFIAPFPTVAGIITVRMKSSHWRYRENMNILSLQPSGLKCFAALRQIRSVRRSLTQDALLTLIQSLVITKLDFCSSALTSWCVWIADATATVYAERRRSD